jgi:hypothetical protein
MFGGVTIMELICHFIIVLPGMQRGRGGLRSASEQFHSKERSPSFGIFEVLEPCFFLPSHLLPVM